MNLKAEGLEHAVAAQFLHLQDWLRAAVEVHALTREDIVDLAADHEARERLLVRFRDRHGCNIVSVAQDGHFVANLKDLLHPVRDIDNGHARFLHFADDAEELFFVRVSDGRGRLVHDD